MIVVLRWLRMEVATNSERSLLKVFVVITLRKELVNCGKKAFLSYFVLDFNRK